MAHRIPFVVPRADTDVDAVQERLICVAKVAAAVKFAGVDGGIVSGVPTAEELPRPLHPVSIHAYMHANTAQ